MENRDRDKLSSDEWNRDGSSEEDQKERNPDVDFGRKSRQSEELKEPDPRRDRMTGGEIDQ
jgi:hypothetical protein